jgi:hypothetical protein
VPLAALLLSLPSCGWFFFGSGGGADPVPLETTHDAGMAALSDCATASSPAARADALARLANAEARLAGSADADLQERVRAAHAYCRETAGLR